jgi:Holliday junction resolvase-like predicted endonuclease
MQLTGSDRYTLEVSLPEDWTTTDRGRFLEDLAASILEQKDYRVNRRVKTAAAEVDILAHHNVEDKILVAECKLQNDPISKNVLELLHSRAKREKAQVAYLFTTAALTSDAKGWVHEYEKGRRLERAHGDPQIIIIGPETFAHMLTSARRLPVPEDIQTGCGIDAKLFLTEVDLVWVFARYQDDGSLVVMVQQTQPITISRREQIADRLGRLNSFRNLPIVWLPFRHNLTDILEIHSAQLGLLIGYEALADKTVTIGTHRYTFAQALSQRKLFRRPLLAEIEQELSERGEVLLVGPEGSGKTIAALMVAADLQNERKLLFGEAAEIEEESH